MALHVCQSRYFPNSDFHHLSPIHICNSKSSADTSDRLEKLEAPQFTQGERIVVGHIAINISIKILLVHPQTGQNLGQNAPKRSPLHHLDSIANGWGESDGVFFFPLAAWNLVFFFP